MIELISVIMPTYKRPYKMISRAIQSIINQTYKNFELIIVDDSPHSYENRYNVKKEIESIGDERIKYIQHEKNMGACAARNTGIKSAEGEYIAFLDDDDEWLPRKLELQYKKITETDAGLVYCLSNTIKQNKDNITSKKLRKSKMSTGWIYEELIFGNFIGSTSFVLIKKLVFDNCGYFNENLKSAQDAELWLRIAKKYKIEVIAIPLVNYYIHEGERISSNPSNKIQGLEMINDLNRDYLELHPYAYSTRKTKIVPFYKAEYGFTYAWKKWYEAFKIYPFNYLHIKYLIKLLLR